MKKIFFIFVAVFISFPVSIFAHIHISSLLPNPEKPFPEQIEVQNFGCEAVNIENFEIRKTDTTKKQIFPKILLHVGEKFTLEMGNFLKNSGDIIDFFNADNQKIETISFGEIQKGEKIQYSHEGENCENPSKNTDQTEEDSQKSGSEGIPQNDNNEDVDEILEPEKGVFADKNGDTKHETFTIFYPETLTGTIDVSKISLFSFQNEEKIIFSGAILSGNIDQNTIVLEFSPEKIHDFDVKNIKISMEEFSGILTTSGKKLSFLNENSFENYTKIEIEEIIKNNEDDNENPHNNQENTENEKNIFPEITPFLQRATDAVLEENIFYCTKKPCRINLNFEEIFTTDFPKEKFSCALKTENQAYRLCNPPQLSFNSEENFVFELIEKQSGKIFTKNFVVDFSHISANNSKNSSGTHHTYYSPPVANIISQGKFENDYKWLSNEEIECFVSPCYVNFSASGSFSPDKLSLKYFWKFGDHIEKIGKNPSSVKLETGKHIVFLTVQDSKGATSYKEISVVVPEKEREDTSKKELKNQKSIEKNSENGKNILDEKVDFSVVELVLQNPKSFQTEDENFYLCVTKNGECSPNFTLENTTKNMRFYWGWDNEVAFESKNPRSKNLNEGEHVLIVQGFDRNNPNIISYEKRIVVRVEKFISPPKTPKKSSKKSTKKSTKKVKEKSTEKSEKPQKKETVEITVDMTEKNENFSEMFLLSGILFSASGFWGYRRGKRQKTSEIK